MGILDRQRVGFRHSAAFFPHGKSTWVACCRFTDEKRGVREWWQDEPMCFAFFFFFFFSPCHVESQEPKTTMTYGIKS